MPEIRMNYLDTMESIRNTILEYNRAFTLNELIARVRVKYAIDDRNTIEKVVFNMVNNGELRYDYVDDYVLFTT